MVSTAPILLNTFIRKTRTSPLSWDSTDWSSFSSVMARTVFEAINAGKETAEGLTGVNTLDELAFAAAVSGDLRNMTYLLEYGWLGTKVEAAHSAVLQAAPWLTEKMSHKGLSPKDVSYGDYVRSAKLSTGMFATWQETLKNIFVGGCSNICQEVATQKLGQAYRVATGSGTQDDAADYIESPYSKRSFIDYQDNIRSIKNSLYGARDVDAPVAKSLLNYRLDLSRNNDRSRRVPYASRTDELRRKIRVDHRYRR